MVQDASATVLRTAKPQKRIKNHRKLGSVALPRPVGSCQPALGHFETSRYHASTVAAGGSWMESYWRHSKFLRLGP